MTDRQNRTGRRVDTRRGTLYIAVLGVTLIVGMVALSSATVGRLELRRVVSTGEQREAELLAQSAVEFGLNQMLNTPNFRDAFTSGVENGNYPLGGGTFTWAAVDEDGDLSDNDSDPFTLKGIGRVGATTVVLQAQATSDGPALTCLEAAVHTEKHLDLKNATLRTNQQASSNGEIKNSNGQLNGDVWTATYVEDASNVSGAVNDNQSPTREMPGANVFDYYLANGTAIPITSLPESGGEREIRTQLLSPGSNPWGETNTQGIYVIDCEGQTINLIWSRFVCTLLLLNVGAGSQIDAEVDWEPAVANYPCLLVDGDFDFDMTGLFGNHALWEGTLFKNFNPDGTPYAGQTDSDISDIYPGTIRGLVYVSGDVTITDESYFEGAFIAHDVHLDADATFDYRDTFLTNPPPGFSGAGGDLEIRQGSWQRAAY